MVKKLAVFDYDDTLTFEDKDNESFPHSAALREFEKTKALFHELIADGWHIAIGTYNDNLERIKAKFGAEGFGLPQQDADNIAIISTTYILPADYERHGFADRDEISGKVIHIELAKAHFDLGDDCIVVLLDDALKNVTGATKAGYHALRAVNTPSDLHINSFRKIIKDVENVEHHCKIHLETITPSTNISSAKSSKGGCLRTIAVIGTVIGGLAYGAVKSLAAERDNIQRSEKSACR